MLKGPCYEFVVPSIIGGFYEVQSLPVSLSIVISIINQKTHPCILKLNKFKIVEGAS